MSKGMKQKTAIVAAFMHNPDILVLDEPTCGLDPLMRVEILELIHKEKAKGKTILDFFRNSPYPSSELQIPEIRLNLNPNRFRLFRYLSERILKRFMKPIAFSLPTRSLETLRLYALSSLVNGFFLLFFLGKTEFAWNFTIP
jgi:hypothetical protein